MSYLLKIFVLLALVGVSLSRVPHTKHYRTADRNVKRHDVSAARAQPVTSVPLEAVSFGQNDALYVANVSVGTPAQTFRLMLDNTFVNAHVLAEKFGQRVNTTVCQENDVKRNTFNYNASKTFSGWMWYDGFGEFGESPYLPYEDPKCLATFGYDSDDFEDTIQIGAVSLPSIPASAIVNFTGPLNPGWTADGFFGLATPRDSGEYSSNTILRFLAPFPRLQMTIYYARTEVGDGHSGSDGVLTLGGADNVNCDSQWVGSYKLNVTEPPSDTWMLNFQSVSIDGEAIGRGGGAPVATRTSFIAAPKDAVDAVIKVTGAEYDFRTDTFQLDCDSRSSLPELVFKDKALEYRVPAIDYARKLRGSDKKCTLMISVNKGYGDWILGTSFFRSYCQLLDYATNTFSLAKVLR